MRIVAITFLCMFAPSVYAGCEAIFVQGSHTGIIQIAAESGAKEEAIDACYPGNAEIMDTSCETDVVAGNAGNQNKFRCVTNVSCTVCGDDLARKYGAQN